MLESVGQTQSRNIPGPQLFLRTPSGTHSPPPKFLLWLEAFVAPWSQREGADRPPASGGPHGSPLGPSW